MGTGASTSPSTSPKSAAKPAAAKPAETAKSSRLFVGANWKCSLETVEEVDKLLGEMVACFGAGGPEGVELCVFAPYVFIERAKYTLGTGIHVGSQNAWDAAEGFACTGVVSAKMLKGIGCRWVLLGHSDRRNVLGETDALISAKVRQCLEAGLNVNITIGEKAEARSAGEELKVLQAQLGEAAKGVPADAWGRLGEREECPGRRALRLWDGGEGFVEYASLPDVDGFVVGRAGLDCTKLSSICNTLKAAKEKTES
ncbi:TIM [Symbiodinium sp. CCMP2456]|nr:TIM [Symbiodinium sp. CCMP2456]